MKLDRLVFNRWFADVPFFLGEAFFGGETLKQLNFHDMIFPRHLKYWY